jgi:hypothetical protein
MRGSVSSRTTTCTGSRGMDDVTRCHSCLSRSTCAGNGATITDGFRTDQPKKSTTHRQVEKGLEVLMSPALQGDDSDEPPTIINLGVGMTLCKYICKRWIRSRVRPVGSAGCDLSVGLPVIFMPSKNTATFGYTWIFTTIDHYWLDQQS